jgi:hypothetical protein
MVVAKPLQKQGRILQFFRGEHVEVAKPPGIKFNLVRGKKGDVAVFSLWNQLFLCYSAIKMASTKEIIMNF